MAIATLTDYAEAAKQSIHIARNNQTGGIGWQDGFLLGGTPAAGADPGNTTTGLVPTVATTGAAPIVPFSGVGYITAVEIVGAVGRTRTILYDRLWHAGGMLGSTGVGTTTTFSSQPSFSSRIPGGTDYTGLQIWAFGSLAGFNANNPTLTVTYTNESGTTGRSTGAATFNVISTNIAATSTVAGLALQAGDCGVQKIESVIFVNPAGNSSKLNIAIVRPLWTGMINAVPDARLFPIEYVGMPVVYTDSCLAILFNNVDGVSATHDITFEIASN